ncbi:MAG: hypothetical protein GY820_14870 [Gammaproteobacteria bacterium]|nr:hypothetical protein [Gammaproteobacteria bacterium]
MGARVQEHKQKWLYPNTKGGIPKPGNAFREHPSPQHHPNFEETQIISQESSEEIREIKEAFLICKAGARAITNENIGSRSAVNKNRGKFLENCWLPLISKIS